MPGMHYDETFAPIARVETWKLILLLALYDQWDTEQWDVEAEYLNSPLHHTVYVEDQQADGSRQVWRLHKALYSLKQAGTEWNDMLKERMGEQGLESTIGDEDCYILRSEGHIICRIATYVDDCLVTAKTREILDMLYKKLNQVIRIDNRGIQTKFLRIECYINKGEIILTQTNLIEKTAVTYGIAYGAKSWNRRSTITSQQNGTQSYQKNISKLGGEPDSYRQNNPSRYYGTVRFTSKKNGKPIRKKLRGCIKGTSVFMVNTLYKL
jgi:hypothetical protein